MFFHRWKYKEFSVNVVLYAVAILYEVANSNKNTYQNNSCSITSINHFSVIFCIYKPFLFRCFHRHTRLSNAHINAVINIVSIRLSIFAILTCAKGTSNLQVQGNNTCMMSYLTSCDTFLTLAIAWRSCHCYLRVDNNANNAINITSR